MPRQTGAFEMELTSWPLFQTFGYIHAHAHRLKESLHTCVFKQAWYHGETSEEALDRSKQKRKHGASETNGLFTQKSEHFTHLFSSTLGLPVYKLQIQNEVTVIKEKKTQTNFQC